MAIYLKMSMSLDTYFEWWLVSGYSGPYVRNNFGKGRGTRRSVDSTHHTAGFFNLFWVLMYGPDGPRTLTPCVSLRLFLHKIVRRFLLSLVDGVITLEEAFDPP
jgi:hypothetical protein